MEHTYDIVEYKKLLVENIQSESGNMVAAINANTSFVTTYPILFPFPASENVFLISRLYQLFGAPPAGTLLNQYVTTDRLFDFFTTSMNQILDYLRANVPRCIVGLEEQNNTPAVNAEYQRVVNAVIASQEGTECVYLIKNIWDSLGGTYPACAFIIKGFGGLDTFANINNVLFTQIWKNDRLGAQYVEVRNVPVHNQQPGPLARVSPLNMLCHSVYPVNVAVADIQSPAYPEYAEDNEPRDNSKKLGTRDLGDLDHAPIDETVYLKGLTATGLPNPDSGRPIIVALQKDNDIVTNVFICLHMLNASVCKRYTKTTAEAPYTPDQFGFVPVDNNQTVLQLFDGQAGVITQDWLNFCILSIERHLISILTQDFGLNVDNFTRNTTFYMCGDFNDPTGSIMTALEVDGITLFGNYTVRFKFGKNNQGRFPITGCPNTNSSLAQGPNPALRPATGNNFDTLFNAINNQGPQPLIDTMRDYFITVNQDNSILNPGLLAFMGDNCAEGSANPQILAEIVAHLINMLNFENLTTDHLIPVVGFERQPNGMDGGRRRRRTRRRNTRRKSHKKRKSYRRHRRRHTRKGRRHSRKR